MNDKGDGGVYYDRQKKKWFAKVPVGRTSTGRTSYWKRTASSRREASEARRELLRQRDNYDFESTLKPTFRSFADEHMKYEASTELRHTTLEGYRYILNKYVYPEFGDEILDTITSAQLVRFLSRMKENYSAAQVNHVRATMSRVFEAALSHELISDNPVRRTKKMRKGPNDATLVQSHWSLEECQLALSASRGTNFECFLFMAIYTGMRHGELLGLMWQDFDFEARTVKVQRTLAEPRGARHRVDGVSVPEFNEPKTSHSRRTLSLSNDLFQVVLAHKESQDREKERIGENWHQTDCVFTTRQGRPFWISNHSNYFRKFLVQKGLRHVRVHDLRHSAATNALELGVGLPEISRMLGHNGIQVTIDLYASDAKGLEDRATSALANYFDENL